MPDKTADALARILSLSSSKPEASEEAQPWRPAPAPVERSPTPGDNALLSSLFFEIVDDGSHAAGSRRPRFNSAMSWTADFNEHSAEHEVEDEVEDEGPLEWAPFNAHGPESYGSFQGDPYGPGEEGHNRSARKQSTAVRAEPVPRLRPAKVSPDQAPAAVLEPYWESGGGETCNWEQCIRGERSSAQSKPEKHVATKDAQMRETSHTRAKQGHIPAGTGSSGSQFPLHIGNWGEGELERVHNQRPQHSHEAGARQDAPTPMSHFIPQWAYETLPRDCLIMLLESALKHMPQESDVVARCMRALAPLTKDEYIQCFGSAPRELGYCSSGAGSGSARPTEASNFHVSTAAGAGHRPKAQESPRQAQSIDTFSRPRAPEERLDAGVFFGRRSLDSGMDRANYLAAAPQHLAKYERSLSASLKFDTPQHMAEPLTVKYNRSLSPTGHRSGTRSRSPAMNAAWGNSLSGGDARHYYKPAYAPGEEPRTNKGGSARTSIRLTESRSGTRTSILTEEQAIEVFKQRPALRSDRASLCSELADRYNVTTTAIRHIWDRRTWVWTNIPYWTKAEMAQSLSEGTCEACRGKVEKIEDTCELCPINRKRGRPRGARDTYRRLRKNP